VTSRIHEILESLASTPDSPERAGLLIELAGLYQSTDPAQALAQAEKAARLSERLRLRQSLASATRMAGAIHEQLGDYPQSVSCGLQALALYRELGDAREAGRCLNNIGLAYTRMGALGVALEHFRRALESLAGSDDEMIRAYVINNIGLTFRSLDDNEKALEHFQRSLEILERAGDSRNVAHALSNIGLCLRTLGDREGAMDRLKKSLAIRQQIGDRFSQVHSWINIANIHRDTGEYGQSYDCLMRAMDLAVDGGNAIMEVYVMTLLAKLKNLSGELDTALEYAEQALPLAEKLGDQNVLRSLYQEFADNHEARRDLSGALLFRFRYFESLVELLSSNIEEYELRRIGGESPSDGGERLAADVRADQARSLRQKAENVCREFNQMAEHALCLLEAREEPQSPPDHLGDDGFPGLIMKFPEAEREGLSRIWEGLRRVRLRLKRLAQGPGAN
jgi:tetratricopeptide (TPR) repeat protein